MYCGYDTVNIYIILYNIVYTAYTYILQTLYGILALQTWHECDLDVCLGFYMIMSSIYLQMVMNLRGAVNVRVLNEQPLPDCAKYSIFTLAHTHSHAHTHGQWPEHTINKNYKLYGAHMDMDSAALASCCHCCCCILLPLPLLLLLPATAACSKLCVGSRQQQPHKC